MEAWRRRLAYTRHVPEEIAVRVVSRVEELDAAQWDQCAGDDDPFVSHKFLHALEASNSATPEEGWLPQHLAIEQNDELIAVAPVYVKGHSYGEYVFDWSWASAYRRAGVEYYPKLQSCVPFSPVPGRRLLVKPGEDYDKLSHTLVAAMLELGRQSKMSGVHVTFCSEDEWNMCGESGMMQRTGVQYHWRNAGYETYDDFLGALLGRKRKQIKRERREAQSCGVELRVLRGGDIEPAYWDAFHEFYLHTIDRKWSSAYLTRDFFTRIGETMADRVVLMMAFEGGKPVAGALHMIGSEALYGRYWGCNKRFRFLHFELCYNRAVELAIELGLKRVEAGAQGQHKIQRGYVPVPTYSVHWLRHPEFRRAVGGFLEREREAMAEERAILMEQSPYSADRRKGVAAE
jgi:predicted N-acyltransferase